MLTIFSTLFCFSLAQPNLTGCRWKVLRVWIFFFPYFCFECMERKTFWSMRRCKWCWIDTCVTITTVSYGFQSDHFTSNFNMHLIDNFPAEAAFVSVCMDLDSDSDVDLNVCVCVYVTLLLHIITRFVHNVQCTWQKRDRGRFLTPYLSCFHSVCMFVAFLFLFCGCRCCCCCCCWMQWKFHSN